MVALDFTIEKRAARSAARAGVIKTPHGTIHTPAFSPVGTRGAIKGVLPDQLKVLGAEVMLANTYHLYLQPGEEIVRSAGGLGEFMSWDGPTITDSGGYQVFSLGVAFGKKVSKFASGDMLDFVDSTSDVGHRMPHNAPTMYDESVASQHGQLAVIDDDGVTFTSHLDGSLHRFTPERSVEIQHALGADIFFAFDECTAPDETYEYQREAMLRTHRWAERSLQAHRHDLAMCDRQMIFGIAQGGQFDDLRRESARTIGEMGFDGFGLGGSFSKKYGDDSLESALKMLKDIPPEMPVHGLGVGEPDDLLLAIAHGVDLFDCVAPTRLGRHGTIYTPSGPINLTNEKYRTDFTPISIDTMYSTFTRAYVSHLLRSGEILGQIIASLHNLRFIISLVAGARQAILYDRFDAYRADFMRDYYHV